MKDYVVYIEDNPDKEGLDDQLILDALGKIKENGGGELRWARTLRISQPIYINYKDYGALSLHGFGEVSKIVVDKNVKPLEYVITIDYGKEDDTDDEYGARGLKIDQVYIDCNFNADHGLVLGGKHPVTQSYFTLLNIVQAKNYGLVLDATQNCHFDLVNIEHSCGGLRLINGAGNNVFTKCEFNEDLKDEEKIRDLPLISFDIDKSRYSYDKNGFGNTPQMNTFIHPVIERYKGKNQINFAYGNHNSFINAEIQYNEIEEGGQCIYFSKDSSYNKISMRLNICQDEKHNIVNKVIPINNMGCNNVIYDSFVENCLAPSIIKSNNIIYCRNIFTNEKDKDNVKNKPNILELYGKVDEGTGYNVDNRIKYLYDDCPLDDLKVGQLGFRDSNNDLLIKMKNGQIFKIMTEKYN